jgi:hypothetical protein
LSSSNHKFVYKYYIGLRWCQCTLYGYKYQDLLIILLDRLMFKGFVDGNFEWNFHTFIIHRTTSRKIIMSIWKEDISASPKIEWKLSYTSWKRFDTICLTYIHGVT